MYNSFGSAAREQSISKAADTLHVTQPTLSRQIMDLEYELGTPLFVRSRHTKRLALTEAGIRFYDYAEQIAELADKARTEFTVKDSDFEGDVYIGAGESAVMHSIAKTIKDLKTAYPHFRYHLLSGDSLILLEKLERGLIDFGIFVHAVNVEKYECLQLPHIDRNGVLMRKDHPLAKKKVITERDLEKVPLLISQQMIASARGMTSRFTVAGSYNLLYNASVLVKEGFACALCIDGLADTGIDSPLTFRPVSPPIETRWNLAWRKSVPLSRAAEVFLDAVRKGRNSNGGRAEAPYKSRRNALYK